jgi:hypothetical protein
MKEQTIEELVAKAPGLYAKVRAIPMSDYRRFCSAKGRWQANERRIQELRGLKDPKWAGVT